METSTVTQLLGEMIVRSATVEDVAVSGVAYRSDRVGEGDAFFCIPGFAHDGHDWAADAVSHGAAAVVVERMIDVDAPQFLVADTRAALARAASIVNGEPSRSLDVVGITGTNGKTTTTYLMDSILRAAGHMTGVIGTVETRIGDARLDASRTTPESADLHALFAQMRDAGVSACSIEVSSHALDLHRVDAVRFAVVAFTNLTQDHLDYHHTLEEYFSVKRKLFTDFETAGRVVNIDDAYGRLLAVELGDCITVGRSAKAAVRAEDVVLGTTGSVFRLRIGDHAPAIVRLPLAGDYNVSNALVSAGCAYALGMDVDTIVAGLTSAPQVPGRLERIDCGQDFSVIVDYAHTPDSLEKAIAAVRETCAGEVIVVFGCGGDRDPDKRPMMGRAAGNSADHVVLTSDNPRTEDPVGIVLQIEDGLRGAPASYEIEVDRRSAIEKAIRRAKSHDTVLIAGKGHEDYQIFSDRTVHFDDRETAREVLGSC